ncbi:hypothetical protein PR048_022352 [Dryococelus australis]|uniref:Uncharacterized protein n=1 Tax=Dryococelus australis TaxID=614101 RepID=A0ABQ9H0S7_9NEOP|nr:hypothetical protein PR048_022352 [Dryococelus australis]
MSMEQCRNEEAGEAGYPRENPPTGSIVRHDSHFDPAGVLNPVRLSGRRACKPLSQRGPRMVEDHKLGVQVDLKLRWHAEVPSPRKDKSRLRQRSIASRARVRATLCGEEPNRVGCMPVEAKRAEETHHVGGAIDCGDEFPREPPGALQSPRAAKGTPPVGRRDCGLPLLPRMRRMRGSRGLVCPQQPVVIQDGGADSRASHVGEGRTRGVSGVSAGMRGRGKREIPGKTRRPAHSQARFPFAEIRE